MTNTDDEMELYSGEQFYKRPPKLSVNRIKFDGNNGSFGFRVKRGDKYETDLIGKSLKVVVLRVRRKLSNWDKGASSTEHNVKSDKVALFQDGKMIARGTAEEIREKYDFLRTIQVLYVYYEGKVYSIDVKGASLGSQNKAPDTISFYDYLRAFNSGSHIWQFWTTIEPVIEKKGAKSYYAMTFKKGPLVDEETASAIKDETKALHEAFTAQDNYERGRSSAFEHTEAAQPPIAEEEIPSLEDDDDISPEDIPF